MSTFAGVIATGKIYGCTESGSVDGSAAHYVENPEYRKVILGCMIVTQILTKSCHTQISKKARFSILILSYPLIYICHVESPSVDNLVSY